ncbi:MAG: hypothetical protein GY743_23345 [Planctomycetaceae bacterium]|nr:hypothetical protein [Planctomycetaceae bacterium]
MSDILPLFILANQRDRNRAIGIDRDTQALRGLAGYARSIEQAEIRADLANVARAAYLRAMIEEMARVGRHLADYIEDHIEDETIRAEGIYALTQLDTYVNLLGDELEALL